MGQKALKSHIEPLLPSSCTSLNECRQILFVGFLPCKSCNAAFESIRIATCCGLYRSIFRKAATMVMYLLSVQETTWSSHAAQETCQFGVSSGCPGSFQLCIFRTIFIPEIQKWLQYRVQSRQLMKAGSLSIFSQTVFSSFYGASCEVRNGIRDVWRS